MKVILLKDVSKIGQRYEVKNVADGYALNFLIPNGFAKLATESEITRVEQERKVKQQNETKKIEELKNKLKPLGKTSVEIFGEANEQGHLFKGIRKEDLQKSIKEKIGIELPIEYIKLEKPIKDIGEHKIQIESEGIDISLTFSVKAKK